MDKSMDSEETKISVQIVITFNHEIVAIWTQLDGKCLGVLERGDEEDKGCAGLCPRWTKILIGFVKKQSSQRRRNRGTRMRA
jgi:hypothetical protein